MEVFTPNGHSVLPRAYIPKEAHSPVFFLIIFFLGESSKIRKPKYTYFSWCLSFGKVSILVLADRLLKGVCQIFW